MRILSLNIRGVGGTPKLSSLRRLVQIVLPDIILVQETMVDAVRARNVLSKLFPCWKCCLEDALGQYGGLYAAWNPSKVISLHL
jgi:exonuclease III